MGLKRANKFDLTEDIKPDAPFPKATVADFFAAGTASAEANQHYGHLQAVQQKYAPFNIDTDLCVGLASVKQNEGFDPRSRATFRALLCGSSKRTCLNPEAISRLLNAATTDFRRPFSMPLPRNEVASGKPLQMQARHLQFLTGENTLRARQLWGALNRRTGYPGFGLHEPQYLPRRPRRCGRWSALDFTRRGGSTSPWACRRTSRPSAERTATPRCAGDG